MLYFIVNQQSGGERAVDVWGRIRRILEKERIDYRAETTKYPGHAVALGKGFSSRGEKDTGIVVVGGDGTVNEVINGITDFEKVRLGVIPTGSGNDFIRGLGVSGSEEEILYGILKGMQQPKEEAPRIDLGRVRWDGGDTPRLFAISAGVGLDAIVCKKALKSRVKDVLNRFGLGKLTYTFLTVVSLFTMKTTTAAMRFDKKEKCSRKKLIFAAAMNFPAEGGGVPMAPKASSRDGKLSVCQAFGIPKWRTFFCLPFLVLGKHPEIKGFDLTDAAECEISLEEPTVLHADGEYCGDVVKIQFQCLPKKLMILNQMEK